MFESKPAPIYLDHHATTPLLPEVVEAMHPFWTDLFGNASSAHAAGRRARKALEDARDEIAQLLDAAPDEIIFTSGATEANNLALFGLVGDPPGHLLAAPIEHPCVIEPLKQLALRGFEVEWLPVEPNGMVRASAIAERLRADTRLVALMAVNHETGAIQPVRAAGRDLARPVAFHCDAAQMIGKLPFDGFRSLGLSSLSASGHKFGGPKGIGLLLLRRGTPLRPLLFGGHQQQGRRPGTEPVALAVGLATALRIAIARMSESIRHVEVLKQTLLNRLKANAAPIVVNGPSNASPYVANVSFPGCRADLLLMKLDLMDVACSTGSACSSGSLLPSPVLKAMNVPDELLHSAMRFSFSCHMTTTEIEEAAGRIMNAVNELRRQ